MNCSYGLQISRSLRDYRRQHRKAQIAKLKEVDKECRSQTESLMRNMRQEVIRNAMEFRKEKGFLDKRSRSYYHRLLDIDKEDAKGGPSMAYIQTTEDDDDDDEDCLTALASNSADS